MIDRIRLKVVRLPLDAEAINKPFINKNNIPILILLPSLHRHKRRNILHRNIPFTFPINILNRQLYIPQIPMLPLPIHRLLPMNLRRLISVN